MTSTACSFAPATAQTPSSPQFSKGKFRNPAAMQRRSVMENLKLIWSVVFRKPADSVPNGAIPVQALTRAQLLAAPDNTLFRLGHSTLLLKIHTEFFLNQLR